jgi:hypothetical protein
VQDMIYCRKQVVYECEGLIVLHTTRHDCPREIIQDPEIQMRVGIEEMWGHEVESPIPQKILDVEEGRSHDGELELSPNQRQPFPCPRQRQRTTSSPLRFSSSGP